MRRLLIISMLCSVVIASDGAVALTPESVRVRVEALGTAERTIWSPCDIDGDGRPSRFEVVAGLVGHPAWFKRNLPDVWKQADANGDGAVSVAELSAIAARDEDRAFTVTEQRRSVRQRLNIGQGMGGGTTMGIGGTRAHVYFGNQQAYIADYNVVNGQYDPVIGVLATGTVLDVADIRITVVRQRR